MELPTRLTIVFPFACGLMKMAIAPLNRFAGAYPPGDVDSGPLSAVDSLIFARGIAAVTFAISFVAAVVHLVATSRQRGFSPRRLVVEVKREPAVLFAPFLSGALGAFELLLLNWAIGSAASASSAAMLLLFTGEGSLLASVILDLTSCGASGIIPRDRCKRPTEESLVGLAALALAFTLLHMYPLAGSTADPPLLWLLCLGALAAGVGQMMSVAQSIRVSIATRSYWIATAVHNAIQFAVCAIFVASTAPHSQRSPASEGNFFGLAFVAGPYRGNRLASFIFASIGGSAGLMCLQLLSDVVGAFPVAAVAAGGLVLLGSILELTGAIPTAPPGVVAALQRFSGYTLFAIILILAGVLIVWLGSWQRPPLPTTSVLGGVTMRKSFRPKPRSSADVPTTSLKNAHSTASIDGTFNSPIRSGIPNSSSLLRLDQPPKWEPADSISPRAAVD